MDDAIARWALRLQRHADVTAATITLYVRDVRHFVAWLAEQARACDLDSITPGDIRDYRTLLLERRRAPATINRILSSLRRFAVRRAAEQHLRRDRGLGLALVGIMRYAGLRVSEVAALQLPDLVLTPRRGLVVVRRGKGLKHREIPSFAKPVSCLRPTSTTVANSLIGG